MNVDADRGRLAAGGPNTGTVLRKVSSNSSISSAASGASLNRRRRTRARSRTVTANPPLANNTPSCEEPVPINTSTVVTADTSRTEEPKVEEPMRMSKAAKQASQLAAIRTKPPPSAFSRVPLSQIDTIESVGVNVRDSMITQESEQTNNSTVYPLSTLSSATASPRSPTYSDRSMQVEDFKSFDEDDVSYRLRLLVNNNYFLPPAHSKPLPNQLAPATHSNGSKKPPAPTFLDLFRIGRSKSKPPTPTSESGNGQTLTPALRTTSDATAVSGFPMQMQNSASASSAPRTSSQGRPTERSTRVVVVREKMADLTSAAKQAELEIKVRSLQRDTRRDQATTLTSIDDVIDPTDAVDLPVPSSTYPFAVQTSALHGLGVSESVGAAALASRLPPPRDRSPALSSIGPDDDDEDWKKALLKAAVGHSFDNLNAAAEGAIARSPRSPKSPSSSMMSSLPPGSPALSPIPPTSASVLAGRISKKIISSPIHLDTSLSKSPSIHSTGHPQTSYAFTNPPRPRGWSSPASPTSPSTAPSPIPIRTETPLNLMPLMPPPRSPRSMQTPRREIINPVYSISQTDLAETVRTIPAGASSSRAENGESTSHPYMMTPPPGHWRGGAVGMTPRESSESSELSFRPRDSSDRATNSTASRNMRTDGSGADEGGYIETPDSLSVYSTMTGNFHNEENLARPRSSMSSSTSTAQSPTTSAFQDALSRNPSELLIDGNSDVRQPQTSQPSVLRDSSACAVPASPPTPTASSIPSTSITPATPAAAPSRTTSLHYRDLRNRHFSAIMHNNPLPSYSSYPYPPSAYPNNMPPPPTLAHRSASDHGHSSFTPPPPASKKRPPTAPAAPALSPRIELIEISAPEPTTPPFPSFASLPSFPSLHSPAHSTQSSPSSPPSPSSLSSPPPQASQPSLIERRHNGGGNPLRGSLHIPTSIIPPAIHSAPPPSSSFPSFSGPSSMMASPPSSSMSFFDTIQSQPNAMDFLDDSSDEDGEDGDDDDDEEEEKEENIANRTDEENRTRDEDNEKYDQEGEEFRTAEEKGGGKEGDPSVTHSALSSLSAYSTPSTRRPSTSRSNHSIRSTRTPLMRLGNHSTPYVSHASLYAYANDLTLAQPDPLRPSDSHSRGSSALHQPFGVAEGIGSIDRKQAIGNIPESKLARDFFTKKMKDDEQVLESKWDLWRYTRQGQGANVAMGSGVRTDANTGTEPEVEVGAGSSSRAYSYSYSSHPYARAYGPHHSRNYSRDAPSSFAEITSKGGGRVRATSSSSDRGYGYRGQGAQNQTKTHALTQAQQKIESQKLDGMLKMHMEAEKDQMKRMAERLKQEQVKMSGYGSSTR